MTHFHVVITFFSFISKIARNQCSPRLLGMSMKIYLSHGYLPCGNYHQEWSCQVLLISVVFAWLLGKVANLPHFHISNRKVMRQFKLLMKVQVWILYVLHFLQQHQMTATLSSSMLGIYIETTFMQSKIVFSICSTVTCIIYNSHTCNSYGKYSCSYLNSEYFAEQMFFVPQILPYLEHQTPSAPARILADVLTTLLEGDTPVP